ncbi:histidine kinase dimerization/phosphoacceptor domain -containing protein [Pseudooceanicola sp. LIPI14-2-Ac024]|uniref:histidine kinase dimerization/phosphoacceptor domain -containing protein n=1 Tax=Pseudooceanicola sp. LIPI14-2-Ac024 TaxID=3344875 RepID=UPI0035D0D33F
MIADPHPSQAARLTALREYDILDTDPEAMFDDIVGLASAICDMPMSIISLVDADRQWFKAEVGMGTRQTTLEESICSHAILTDGFLEVEDTTLDPRTMNNPLVLSDPNLQFYAGAVLLTPEGLPLGSLCVLDDKPRQLTPLQREALRVLARQVMTQLDLRRALREADILRREVDHRVKNSLQSISSLTRLQARRAGHPDTREALDIVRRRVDTVAALHEALYRAETDGMVAMKPFVEKVVTLIRSSAPEGVRIVADVAEADISPTQATGLGVILNEFAANTFKHAFPDGAKGALRIDGRCEGDEIFMVIADDGVGFDGQHNGQSLGLTVMETSAHQMRADYALKSGPEGTRLTLDFPADC